MRPYGSKNGSSVSVLAISFGSGGRDAVMAVFLDAKGHLNSQAKFDGLGATEDAESFTTFVKENKPDVVVIGGFTAETHRLRIEADGILKNIAATDAGGSNMMQGISGIAGQEYMDVLSQRQIPLIYVHDEVARLYMNSARATQENPAWPANARYALGLARFTQDPLNEYCALGSDLVAVTYVPKQQALVSSFNGKPRPDDFELTHRGLFSGLARASSAVSGTSSCERGECCRCGHQSSRQRPVSAKALAIRCRSRSAQGRGSDKEHHQRGMRCTLSSGHCGITI